MKNFLQMFGVASLLGMSMMLGGCGDCDTDPTTPVPGTTTTTTTTLVPGTAAKVISGAGVTTDAGPTVATTYSVQPGNYSATIAGFGPNDVLKFFPAAIRNVVPDTDDADGIQAIRATDPATGATSEIVLTGLTPAQDAALFNVPSFATVFGAGTIQ